MWNCNVTSSMKKKNVTCLCLCVCPRGCGRMNEGVHIGTCVLVCVYVHMCACMPLRSYVHMLMCACASVCMCVWSGRSRKHSLSLSRVTHTQPLLNGNGVRQCLLASLLNIALHPRSLRLSRCPLLSPLPAGEPGHRPLGRSPVHLIDHGLRG